MTEVSSSFKDRLNFEGDFDQLVGRIMKDFAFEEHVSYSVIEVGFEDFNIKVSTSKTKYLVKIFSKKRDDTEVERYAHLIEKIIAAGVHHPEVFRDSNGLVLHKDDISGLKMVAMSFVEGKTFYDSHDLPDDKELQLIAAEAVKINSINYDPPYIFDGWAIPNMEWMFEKTKGHLSSEGKKLVEMAFDYYNAIPFDQLPKCLVHGDLIKTNIIKSKDGKIYVIDFAVANTYPRIQELAVMAANLLFDEKSEVATPLRERVERVVNAYLNAGGVLSDVERSNVFNYALPGAAMEYMGSVSERMNGDNSSEIMYWEKLGLNSLKEALS